MDKFREKIANFMYGRYGIDQLYYALVAVSFILILINTAVQSQIINIFMYVILLLMLLRTFSKDLYKRQRENALNFLRTAELLCVFVLQLSPDKFPVFVEDA